MTEPPPPEPRLLIERALDKTRKDALKQTLMTAGFSVLWIFVLKPVTWGWILIGLNVLVALILARRFYRLRASSPAVQALLTAPERIASFTGFPANVPANQVPVFIDVRTHDGHVCTLLQEPKHNQPTIDLVRALYARSPDAKFEIANVPVPLPAPATPEVPGT